MGQGGARVGPRWDCVPSAAGRGQTVPAALGTEPTYFVPGLSLPTKATAMTSAWLALGVSMAKPSQGVRWLSEGEERVWLRLPFGGMAASRQRKGIQGNVGVDSMCSPDRARHGLSPSSCRPQGCFW